MTDIELLEKAFYMFVGELGDGLTKLSKDLGIWKDEDDDLVIIRWEDRYEF